ncbi:rh77 [macacine betaherpesvirus 3]|uniref:Rh77 n=1 Tax=Rhesus cytomegalovirus (strain 68-1) TaxID=47929 RepID=Q2FAP2_RHCM6|nr:rh77 [macacine betaherpesvirus 3]
MVHNGLSRLRGWGFVVGYPCCRSSEADCVPRRLLGTPSERCVTATRRCLAGNLRPKRVWRIRTDACATGPEIPRYSIVCRVPRYSCYSAPYRFSRCVSESQ